MTLAVESPVRYSGLMVQQVRTNVASQDPGTHHTRETTTPVRNQFATADAIATCGGQPATIQSNDAIIYGTAGRDVIVSGPADQVIYGFGFTTTPASALVTSLSKEPPCPALGGTNPVAKVNRANRGKQQLKLREVRRLVSPAPKPGIHGPVARWLHCSHADRRWLRK